MTYTVKNGTWCKDNEKEYYSTTRTGLKAALKAGEISAGTKVVVHEPRYNTGDLVKSFNPNCPEGCFVPDGSAFDTEVYTALAAMFPDGKLPDLRECSLVMVGRSERPEITNHDEYAAGQFKNDQFAEHNHTATSTVTDPGHVHDVTDPGHAHTVTDEGHDHGRGTQNITGTYDGLQQDYGADGTATGAFSGSVNHRGSTDGDTGHDRCVTLSFTASNSWTGRSEKVTADITVDSNTTGVSVDSHVTGISVDTTLQSAGAADNVTHGKQVGVYYYIAF